MTKILLILFLDHNKISVIENLPCGLTYFDANITNFGIELLELENLKEFYYDNETIISMPILVQHKIIKLDK